MEFKIKKRGFAEKKNYIKADLDLAYKFTNKLYKELGEFIKAVVIFGSTASREDPQKRDIDLLIIVDDVSIVITKPVVEAYRIITGKIIREVSPKVHVTTMKFTTFWDYVRVGDPLAISILRSGVALIDSNFFTPLQALLHQGRIRPSKESVWRYFSRAPMTLLNSKWHLLQGTLDLYWGVVDSAHAALMSIGEIPPSPEHVADMMEEKLVKKKLLDKRYVAIMREFYKLQKMIIHREIKDIVPREYDRYYREAQDFINTMKKFMQKTKK